MDILAISKDRRELLVVELKKGQAADKVVGQILRYMGYAAQELAEEGQTVKVSSLLRKMTCASEEPYR